MTFNNVRSHILLSFVIIMSLNIIITCEPINQDWNDKSNDTILTYIYPISKNITLPKNCTFSNKTRNCEYIVCVCKQNIIGACSYRFKQEDIWEHITFNKPYFIVRDIVRYGYYINQGINNFKINPQSCSTETCSPIVTYMIWDHLTFIIEIVYNYRV